MTWNLRMIDPPPASEAEVSVGDAWFATRDEQGRWCMFAPGDGYRFPLEGERTFYRLSPEYYANNANRPPLCVYLPGNNRFCVDACTWSQGAPGPHGWAVRGEPPLITVSPSIHLVGSYHGFINSGVISDDCDGRRF